MCIICVCTCRFQDLCTGSLSVWLWGSTGGDSLPLPICRPATGAGWKNLCRWAVVGHKGSKNHVLITVMQRKPMSSMTRDKQCVIWSNWPYIKEKHSVKKTLVDFFMSHRLKVTAHWKHPVGITVKLYYVVLACLAFKSAECNLVPFLPTKLPTSLTWLHRRGYRLVQ